MVSYRQVGSRRDSGCRPPPAGWDSRPRRERRGARTLLAVVVPLVVAAGAAPAEAHTELVNTIPSPGSRASRAPTRIQLRFTDAVRPRSSAVTLALSGHPRTRLAVRRADREPHVLVAQVDPDAARGAPAGTRWLVGYRVTLGDGPPIRGSFVFDVGRPPTPGASALDESQSRGWLWRMAGPLMAIGLVIVLVAIVGILRDL
jgi:methionine-rich copper-binding protein CopC